MGKVIAWRSEGKKKEKYNLRKGALQKKMASKPGQSSWSKERVMLPSLKGRMHIMLFLCHNNYNLFNISLHLVGLKET